MRVLLQRVSHASVSVSGGQIGSIQRGVLLFVGFGRNDCADKLKPMAEKIANMRIFPDENSKFQFSVLDIKGGALLVPQFTLYADVNKGRRPDFFSSLEPAAAKELFRQFIQAIKSAGITETAQGEFGAHMHVLLENDGPVTIMVEL